MPSTAFAKENKTTFSLDSIQYLPIIAVVMVSCVQKHCVSNAVLIKQALCISHILSTIAPECFCKHMLLHKVTISKHITSTAMLQMSVVFSVHMYEEVCWGFSELCLGLPLPQAVGQKQYQGTMRVSHKNAWPHAATRGVSSSLCLPTSNTWSIGAF